MILFSFVFVFFPSFGCWATDSSQERTERKRQPSTVFNTGSKSKRKSLAKLLFAELFYIYSQYLKVNHLLVLFFLIQSSIKSITWQHTCWWDDWWGWKVEGNGRWSMSTWTWAWSCMGFTAVPHCSLNNTVKWPHCTQQPPLENISTLTCWWKACVHHVGRDWRSDLCFTLEQTAPSSFLAQLTISVYVVFFFLFVFCAVQQL